VRTPLLLLVPIALLAACSSGGGSTPQSLDTTSTPAATATSGPGTSATAAVTAPTRQATKPAAASAAPDPLGSRATTPLSTTAPGKPAARKATASGHYSYTSSGKVTVGATPQSASGTQTLTISPLKGDVQHSTLHSDDSGDTEEDLVVRDTGTYGASLTLTSPAFTKEFRPSPAVLLVPDPAAIGQAWSWSATSTDGATHLSASNKVLRDETLTIGGTKVATVVLQTHLVLSGDVSYDAQLTVWWAPSYRLPVKTHTVGKGSYSGIPFSTDITAVLTSVKPS
jgi:hypothetical protein